MGAPPLRVLHAPMNIAGHPAGLASGERALGADSRAVALLGSDSFPADETLSSLADGLARREMARVRLLVRALRQADVVHFNFGHTLLSHQLAPDLIAGSGPVAALKRIYARALWLRDGPLLAAAGKTLVMTWQGDDARQGDVSRRSSEVSIASHAGADYYGPGRDAAARQLIARADRFVQLHYALNPDLLHVLPQGARFLPYASFDPASVAPRLPSAEGGRPLRVAHAPSSRAAKGTDLVLAAVEGLVAEGGRIELDLIEGLPRNEAMARYREADIVVDQLLAGWYGGLAVEAMSLGKPVIAYIREGDLDGVPAPMRAELPIVRADPASIAGVLRDLATQDRAALAERGRRSRAFVERWHDPRRVAATTLADYAALRRREPGRALEAR